MCFDSIQQNPLHWERHCFGGQNGRMQHFVSLEMSRIGTFAGKHSELHRPEFAALRIDEFIGVDSQPHFARACPMQPSVMPLGA